MAFVAAFRTNRINVIIVDQSSGVREVYIHVAHSGAGRVTDKSINVNKQAGEASADNVVPRSHIISYYNMI